MHGLGHFRETRIAAVRGGGPHLRRLVGEHIARGVLAVDADVPLRAAAELALEADVAGLHLHRELRIEVARVADALLAHEVGDFEVAAFEVQPVGRHRAGRRCARRPRSCVRSRATRGRQRFLAQHVQAGVGGADGPGGVQGVGQRDVHGVDVAAREEVARVVIRMQLLDAVALAELP